MCEQEWQSGCEWRKGTEGQQQNGSPDKKTDHREQLNSGSFIGKENTADFVALTRVN
jgi:hypothetical protein